MKRKSFILIAMLLIASLLVTACGSKPAEAPAAAPAAEEGPIKIGGIYPLSGAIATFGQSSKKALDLAFEEINANGGLLGRKVEFVLEDNKSTQADSATAAQKLTQQDKVVAILGAVASSNSLAAAPIAQEAKVPMVSSSSTNPAVTEVGEYIFRAAFIDPFQGQVMANFASKDLKAMKAAIMTDANSDYSIGLANVFKDVFTKNGGTIVSEVSFVSGDTDFNAILTTVKNSAPDVVFVPSYYDTVGLILNQAKNNVGFLENVVFLGGDGWDSPALFELAGDAANGHYFSNHYSPDVDSPEVDKFIEAFKAKYNETPDALAALAYDTAYMVFEAIKTAGSADSTAIRDALTKIELKAVTGTIKLNEKRDPVKSAVVIKIEDGKQKYFTTVNP
ncbi:branched-chain amino acid transport system substrate-binding protein [Anaerosolibacter carboniphilus]|uniref:Branched-chain amino acid transport system substrate-binding protein n=1 Tax=Anaerosolibacter carboniphilus TaxID=1417629 RepID=A0A841L7S4_9FIRM|nr:ABC transporter substrate-binding protein [Anaerosolibacter carboniphilus]MBB6218315.1 branched-chain amino acid transport system substrate-binding protein [Anaerosolibacter carboniphilus]